LVPKATADGEMTTNYGYYAYKISVPIESPYATSY